MGNTARITVASGPDRGKVFQLNEELVHIGSGAANQIALGDNLVSEHQASIVRRDGRYAIYTPLQQTVQVDGNTIPAERWVWLPSSARISVSDRTTLEFDELAGEKAAAAKPGAPAKGQAARSGKGKRSTAKRRRSGGDHSVAQFITDRQGDTLVKLGEDGHLPELHLAEGKSREVTKEIRQQSNPALLYAVLGLSLCASLLLFFVDFESSSRSAADVVRARREIEEFYGINNDELKPYQKYLRDARLAHSRNDRAAERRAYRKVLDLLNAEDVKQTLGGVTGNRREKDKRLKELVTTLYSGNR